MWNHGIPTYQRWKSSMDETEKNNVPPYVFPKKKSWPVPFESGTLWALYFYSVLWFVFYPHIIDYTMFRNMTATEGTTFYIMHNGEGGVGMNKFQNKVATQKHN